MVEGAPRRVRVCTQCIKSNKVKKAVVVRAPPAPLPARSRA